MKIIWKKVAVIYVYIFLDIIILIQLSLARSGRQKLLKILKIILRIIVKISLRKCKIYYTIYCCLQIKKFYIDFEKHFGRSLK